MQEKETNELEQVLGRTHLAEYNVFLEKHKGSMLSDSTSFSAYVNLCQSNYAGKRRYAADCIFKGGHTGALWIQTAVR